MHITSVPALKLTSYETELIGQAKIWVSEHIGPAQFYLTKNSIIDGRPSDLFVIGILFDVETSQLSVLDQILKEYNGENHNIMLFACNTDTQEYMLEGGIPV